MNHYRIEALVSSDRGEDNLAMFVEGLFEGNRAFDVRDLVVYGVAHHGLR